MFLGSVPVLAFLAYRWNAHRHRPCLGRGTVLAQQTVALRTLVKAADRGGLLGFRQVLVVVDQGLVQDLLSAAMPIEGLVGSFHVRIESAEASFGAASRSSTSTARRRWSARRWPRISGSTAGWRS